MDTRETATAILLGALFVIAMCSRDTRTMMWDIIKTLVRFRDVTAALLGLVAYAAVLVTVADRFGAWSPDLVGDTVLVFCIWLSLFFDLENVSSTRGYLRRRVWRVIGVGSVVSFYLSAHTLSLGAELFLQFTIFILAMSIASSRKANQAVSPGLAMILVATITLFLTSNTAAWLIRDWGTLDRTLLLQKLALPAWMILAFVPVVFVASRLAYRKRTIHPGITSTPAPTGQIP